MFNKYTLRCVQLILTSSVLMLVGCTTTKVQDDETIKSKIAGNTMFTPQSWATNVDEAQLKSAKEINWLDSFKDPLLIDLVKQALANNRDLMASAAGVERANALAVQAGAQLKPQVNLSFANSRSGSAASSSSQASSHSLAIQLSWEQDLWGRISAGQRAAVASADAAASDYKYAQHSIAAATIKAYFISIEAGQQANVLREVLTSLEETSRIVNVQYKNGLISAQDVALTKSDLASTREQLITLEASHREALRALEILLGRYPKGDFTLGTDLPNLPNMPPIGIPSELLERRPDLIASERRVAAAFNVVKQAKAAQLPQLSLTGNLGGTSSSLSDITSSKNVLWQLATNLLVPIFDGGVRQAQLEVATADQKQALASYAKTALNAFNEIETNLDLANTLLQRKSELVIALNESEKAYNIADLRYKEGEIALIDLLAIQQRVLSAKSNKLSIQRLTLEQRVNLYLALGGSWEI